MTGQPLTQWLYTCKQAQHICYIAMRSPAHILASAPRPSPKSPAPKLLGMPSAWHMFATLHRAPCCRLAHCSAGKFSPEYSWQQAQMPYCHDYWQDGQWVNGGPNQACYCADSDWKNMDVIPDIGKALDLAESGSTVAARQAGRVAGVTRMLYGTIPSTWGRMPNGSLAAWSSKLISV